MCDVWACIWLMYDVWDDTRMSVSCMRCIWPHCILYCTLAWGTRTMREHCTTSGQLKIANLHSGGSMHARTAS